MQKRALATLVLPLGVAACSEPPTIATVTPVAVHASAVSANELAAPIADERMTRLAAALDDAELRLAPAVSGGGDGSPLRTALDLVRGRLATADGPGIEAALADVEAVLAALPDAGAVLPEIDAMRLALDEVRSTAATLHDPPRP
ncbi:hypothetical protein [Longimicrobium sp.]|jgi:hypothetical protein|uniref:hypothetical protein n=1 Tax=Longimicrobium sp. TaxID=2029185 RepID=UPI002ED8D6E0